MSSLRKGKGGQIKLTMKVLLKNGHSWPRIRLFNTVDNTHSTSKATALPTEPQPLRWKVPAVDETFIKTANYETKDLYFQFEASFFYFQLAWVTRCCPGWFKIGIKNSIETQGLIWYRVEPPPPKNLPPSRTTSVPNFILIRPAFWISIENRHTHRQTHIALYVLDKQAFGVIIIFICQCHFTTTCYEWNFT